MLIIYIITSVYSPKANKITKIAQIKSFGIKKMTVRTSVYKKLLKSYETSR